MKYLVITRRNGMSELIDEDIRDRFEVVGISTALVGNVYKNPLLLFDCPDLVTDDILGYLCTKIDCPYEEVKVYNLLTKKNLKDTTRRLVEDEIKQSHEFQALKNSDENTWLRLAARTTINNMAAIDHYDYLESEQKGLGDWWLLEEAKDLVYRLEKIVGDFNPNEF